MKKFTEWVLERDRFDSETLFHEMAVQSSTAQNKIKKAFDFVNKHKLGCVLVGGMAVAHYVSRAITPDVDFMCLNIQTVKQALDQEGLTHSPLILPRELQSGGITCHELDADFLDATAGNSALNRYILKTATVAMIGGFTIPIIDPVTLTIVKFANGREKDLDDAFKLSKVINKQSLKDHLKVVKKYLDDDMNAQTIWQYVKAVG
jgi:hypothetical protein